MQQREVSPTELLEEALTRIAAAGPAINAVVTVDEAGARDTARRLQRSADLRLLPLAGVPFAVKESEPVRGWRSTHGDPAAIRQGVELADSAQVGRLRAAGAVPVGATNTALYGAWAETTNPLFGTTLNPWDTQRIPGGSSGGSAAAVAGGLLPFATGSDGGGSIRIPASACGIVGFKPSWGVVPDHLHAADETHLAVRAPMARTTAETALLLNVVVAGGGFGSAGAQASLQGLRVAWSATFGYADPDSRLLVACEGALRQLSAAGAVVEAIEGPLTHDPLDVFAVLFGRSLRSAVAGARGSGDVDGLPVALMEWLGAAGTLSQSQLAGAEAGRHALVSTFEDLFDSFDVLASPTTAQLPPPAPHPDNEWVKYTHPLNLYGGPAVSLPVGLVMEDGHPLPVGMQLAARRGDDRRLLATAASLEAALGLELRPPPIPATTSENR